MEQNETSFQERRNKCGCYITSSLIIGAVIGAVGGWWLCNRWDKADVEIANREALNASTIAATNQKSFIEQSKVSQALRLEVTKLNKENKALEERIAELQNNIKILEEQAKNRDEAWKREVGKLIREVNQLQRQLQGQFPENKPGQEERELKEEKSDELEPSRDSDNADSCWLDQRERKLRQYGILRTITPWQSGWITGRTGHEDAVPVYN